MTRLAPLLLLALSACATAQSLDLPPRAPTARVGSAILPLITGLTVTEREAFVWSELTAGNVPNFLRQLVPITLTRNDANGQPHTVRFEVAPDYVALGSDTDWFRIPMTPILGQQICDRLDCTMPTRRMSDDIWAHAPVHLNPVTFSPTIYDILAPALFYQHHTSIESQRAGNPLGLVVAGIKKDVVITARLGTTTARVAIYGWHWPTGVAIQPLSTVHGEGYADYSHGVRLVRNRVLVDGQPTTVAAIVADPVKHPLLSDEGAFTSSRYNVPPAPETFPFIDAFPTGGPELTTWTPKFTQPTVQSLAALSRGGDGWVVNVRDPAGGTDSLRLARPSTGAQVVQADLYCEYRPALAADGFERIGVFARDNAAGSFDGTQSQNGACYAFAWDSSNGRVWCMRVQGGVKTDLLPAQVFRASTAWRRFRIEARGSALRFLLDGVELLAVTDATFPTGDMGIGFHEYFTTNANMRGTRADNFFADVPDALRFTLESRPGNEVVFDVRRGVPADIYFAPVTLSAGAFPNGWFFGLDPTLESLGGILASAHPAFIGLFDADGVAHHSMFGIPLGLPLWGVAIDVLELLPPVAIAPPITHVVQ